MSETKEFLTIEEAAERMGKKPRTIYKYIKENKLPSFALPVGRGFLVKASDVDDLMKPRARGQERIDFGKAS